MDNIRDWKDIEYFTDSFNKRTAALIDLLDAGDDVKNVIDIGCGMMFAQNYLREKYGIFEYYGLDYKKRDDATLVCDLNKHEFVDKSFDLFLVAGCLEYVEDIDWFFSQFSKCRKYALISYCAMEYNDSINNRKTAAWKNHMYKYEIVKYMEKVGFDVVKEDLYCGETVIYKFMRCI